MRNNHVKFGDSLPETSKSSAFWDMGVKCVKHMAALVQS